MDTVQRLTPELLGSRFLKDLNILHTADVLRGTQVAPGMISYLERAMLQNLVKTTWRGEGAIIDAGSFFGGSIVPAAEGLRSNEHAEQLTPERFPDGKPIHGYELGRFPQAGGQKDQVRNWYGVDYHAGDSFVHMLEKAVAPYPDLVELHIGDVTEESWSADAPIEVAFIDVCRSKNLNAHVAKEFLPALIPGGSTLIYRDFFFDLFPWLKVTMGHLKDYFTWEGQVQTSSVYRTVKEVPADVAAYDPFVDATYDECLALHDAVDFPGLHRRYEFRMGLSRAHLMRLKGHSGDALDTLEELKSEYADVLANDTAEHGEQFRLDRALRQASANTFKVQAKTVARLIPDVLGTKFLNELDVVETADALRKTEVAPGMLSYLERSLIQSLVTKTWRGEGAIIDGGSFFGSSIVALAEGIRANEQAGELQPDRFPDGKPIHGYELGYFPLPEGSTPQVRHLVRHRVPPRGQLRAHPREGRRALPRPDPAPHRGPERGALAARLPDRDRLHRRVQDDRPQRARVEGVLPGTDPGRVDAGQPGLLLRPVPVDQGHHGPPEGLLQLGGAGPVELGLPHPQGGARRRRGVRPFQGGDLRGVPGAARRGPVPRHPPPVRDADEASPVRT